MSYHEYVCEGFDAFGNAFDHTDCPYRKTTQPDEYDAWQTGWSAAWDQFTAQQWAN